jgi:hypothetical protein
MSSRTPKPLAPKRKLHELHIMRIGATPAKLVGIVQATDEKAAIAEPIKTYRIRPIDVRRLIALRAA